MSFFFSFLFFRFSSNWERERRVYNIGYKEKRSQSLLIFFFSTGFLWRIFPLLRANRLYAIFNTGLKKWLLHVWDILFVFFYPEYLAFGSVRHEPCPTTDFLIIFFRWWEEGATSVFMVPAYHLASTFFLPVSGDPREVSKYKHLFLTVILWRLATVNSNTRIVVILFLSSQWDTTWQFGWVLWHIKHCRLFNVKSSLYIYIKYIWFGLVGFYGISTIVGYLMPNPLYTYTLNIYDLVWLGFMAYQPL